jgi:hypothetical protein
MHGWLGVLIKHCLLKCIFAQHFSTFTLISYWLRVRAWLANLMDAIPLCTNIEIFLFTSITQQKSFKRTNYILVNAFILLLFIQCRNLHLGYRGGWWMKNGLQITWIWSTGNNWCEGEDKYSEKNLTQWYLSTPNLSDLPKHLIRASAVKSRRITT